MATLLLHKNRALRALALVAIVALLVGVRASQTSYATSANRVEWLTLQTCGNGNAVHTLKANGTAIASFTAGTDCTCDAPLTDLVITDPALLASAGQGCANWQMAIENNSLVAWSKVKITRPGGIDETACIYDASNRGCVPEEQNLCNNGYNGFNNTTLTAPAPDVDHDGQSDCVDTDIDGDGILNAADNCPINANSSQIDSDGNGKGDACDPPDVDGDGVLNIHDNCANTPNSDQLDANGNGTGDACEIDGVIAVPWLGSEQLPHQVYSGGTIVLQAVSFKANTPGVKADLVSATWDAGDGSAPQAVSVANALNLELEHTYTGAAGQPFTATISVVDGGGHTFTDTFKVVIASNSRETKVNMAIDRGLWNLHKTLARNTADGQNTGNWSGPQNLAATASSVQAFEINNHRESGNVAHDPYVDDVTRGLRWIMSSGNIQKINVGLQNGNNPDSNGNGFGLSVNNGSDSSYIGGQVMDAIVASGTPTAVAATGVNPEVKGRQYKDIVQDLLDGYSWGMSDNTGGWHYGFNDVNGSNDTSASHWWGIGVLASHTWNLDAPAWVKNIQLNTGVPRMQDYAGGACLHTSNGVNGTANNDGHFGYTDSKSWLWDNGTNTTAAGLILLNADGVAQTNARFTCASQFLADRYNTSMGNFYTMYQLTKAMRTAIDGTGQTAGIANLNGTIDWYAGYADYLVGHQSGKGQFTSNGTAVGGTNDLTTSWAIIILSPTLFELPPSASCSVSPATIGKNGGTVNFSAAASFHPDPNATITGYSWNFDDGTAAGTGVATSHAYAVPASFPTSRNATVTVTDSNGNSSTASCPVQIVNNNVPPSVTIAGPYTVCQGSPLTLTATAADEDGTIGATEWDLNTPINFAAIDATGLSVDATAAFASKAPGTYNIGFRAEDDNHATSAVFSTVKVIPANDASCNQPPVAVNDAASTLSGTPVTVTVLGNDTDADHNTLTVTSATQGANGSTVINGDGTVTYSPNLGFAGTDTFTYAISDGHGGTSSANVTITVTKRQAILTAGSGTKVYGASDPALTPIASGFLGDITIAQTPRAAGEAVGSYATHASATGATLANYDVTYNDGTFTITPATTTTVVTCSDAVYNGAAQQTCSANVTGTDLNQTLAVTYANNTNVGTATGSASYAGDANHTGSNASATFEITKSAPVCSVTPYSVTYNTAAHTATGSCTGVRGESLSGLNLSATSHTNAGTYNDAWTFTDVTGNYSNTGGLVTDVIAKAPTKTSLAISTNLALAGAPVTLTATVVSVLPGAGTPNGTVTFTEGATVLGTGTLNASGVATFTTTTLSNGPHTITAAYNESANFLSSAANTVSTLIYGFATGGGTFVIADKVATLNATVNFWGSQWEKNNIPSGGASNASFKGFAITPAAPVVGQTFTSAPGNSAPPPAGVPQYIGIIVTSKVTKSGSSITGTIVKMVVVKVNAGYAGDPGNPGTGTIVAFIQ